MHQSLFLAALSTILCCDAFSPSLQIRPLHPARLLRGSVCGVPSRTIVAKTKVKSSPLAAITMQASQQASGTVIIGGGIAGLATAAALQNIAGVSDVKVLEATSQESFLNERAGAGAQLGPNGLKALKCIGGDALLSKVMEAGAKLEGNVIMMPSPPGHMTIPDTAEVDTGLPQTFIRWGVLRAILADLLPSGCVSTGVGGDVVGYRMSDVGAVKPVTRSGDLAIMSSDSTPLIVGADGVASTFRYLVQYGRGTTTLPENGEVSARRSDVKDGGRVNIKAVVPKKLDPNSYKPGHTYGYFVPGGGVACFAGPAGADWTYWAISVADEKDANTGMMTRFLSDASENRAVKEQLLSKLHSLDTPECKFVVDLIESTDPATIYSSRSEEATSIGPDLVSQDGKVVLVGDAAHAMSASYGQAANFALEDAATLAVCVRENKDLHTALKKYSESRVARCLEMQKRSAERAAKAMKGEATEDVSKWIFQWNLA